MYNLKFRMAHCAFLLHNIKCWLLLGLEWHIWSWADTLCDLFSSFSKVHCKQYLYLLWSYSLKTHGGKTDFIWWPHAQKSFIKVPNTSSLTSIFLACVFQYGSFFINEKHGLCFLNDEERRWNEITLLYKSFLNT